MSTERTQMIPAMWVNPWDQRGDGFFRYEWSPETPLGLYTVVWTRNEKRELVRHQMFHHWKPVRGLIVVWESDKAPTLEELSRFVPVDWEEP